MVATRSAFRNGTPVPTSPPAAKSQPLSNAPRTPGSTQPATEMTTVVPLNKPSSVATPAGEITVRPFRSSSNAQLKSVLSFTPRTSALDRQNVNSQGDTFRGFFTLFWIGLALLFMRTSLESWETNKTPLSWNFGRLITRDAIVLAFSDALMVLSMFLCVPFVKALQHGWFGYYWTGVVAQHLFQTVYLGVAIAWGIVRDWYWVQSGFLVLHALSNMMKMHSYMSHNGMLSTVAARLKQERVELERHLDTLPGGKEAALAEANKRRSELEAQQRQDETPGPTPLGTPSLSAAISLESLGGNGTMTPGAGSGLTGYNFPAGAARKLQADTGDSGRSRESSGGISPPPSTSRATASTLFPRAAASTSTRRRRSKSKHLATDALPTPERDLPHGTSLEPSANTTPHEPRAPHLLGWSSDEKVALLARNIDAMEDELRSNGVKGMVWPQNVTYTHFADFMIIPTLVYQLEYPRTATMNPFVMLEKVIATFGTFSLIYLITEHYIYPFLPKPEDTLFKSFINLALPMMINYLLIIFECVCQGFAELSYFADREFYQDWWNSTSWDQFSRKWNKPVHTFLLRHVYASTMDGLQLSKLSASFVTFLLSALCHELVMAVVSKKVRPYLFLMQMAQVPMIALGRLPVVRRNKTIGNIVFWVGLMAGFPLLAIGYLKY